MAVRIDHRKPVQLDVIGAGENIGLQNVQAHRAQCRSRFGEQAVPIPGAKHDLSAAAFGQDAGPSWHSRGWGGPILRSVGLSDAQKAQVRQIIEGLGLSVATPDEAREILELKGADRVAF